MIKQLAFLVLGCLVTTSSLKAAISISGKAAGRFENAIGPASMVVSGIGTSKLSWAKTLSNSAVQNEFEFIPFEFSASEYEYFSLGRFRYGNGVTETNTQADEVDLVIDLELQDGVSRPFSFTIDTAVTVNTDNPDATGFFTSGGSNYSIAVGASSIDDFAFVTVDVNGNGNLDTSGMAILLDNRSSLEYIDALGDFNLPSGVQSSCLFVSGSCILSGIGLLMFFRCNALLSCIVTVCLVPLTSILGSP